MMSFKPQVEDTEWNDFATDAKSSETAQLIVATNREATPRANAMIVRWPIESWTHRSSCPSDLTVQYRPVQTV